VSLNFEIMKKVVLLMVIGLALTSFYSCNNSDKDEKENLETNMIKNPDSADGSDSEKKLPEISFRHTDHHFGTIIQGESVSYTFRFTNTGNADLVITDANASCGCTIPRYSKEPVAPGEEGEIEVIFDSSGKEGKINKSVTILANTQPNTHKLTITGEVEIP